MRDEEEMLDLVDENNKVIGTILHSDAPSLLTSKAGFIRGTVGFIQNNKGKLWIPKRTADKKISPNGLDFGVAEHVQAGETYEESIIRGFKEELYLDTKKNDFKFLGILDPVVDLPYFFIAAFLYKAEKIDRFNPEDFTSYQWLDPVEVIELIKSGVPAKNALQAAIETFLL